MIKILKNIILLALSASITITGMAMPVFAESAENTYISDIVCAEGTLKFTVSNLDVNSDKKNIKAYAAEYDENSNVIGIAVKDVDVINSSEQISLDYNLHGNNKLKVFLWNSDMTPLAAAAERAGSADIYVTISKEGSIVTSKNDEYIANKQVKVNDLNGDGRLNIDEALYAAHEQFYSGDGYASANTGYGLSISKLWGDESYAFGYYVNDKSAWSLDDEIKEGDCLKAFIYADKTGYSDKYSYFAEPFASAKAGENITLSLTAEGFDENWNTVSMPYSGASVKSADGTKIFGTTDENGEITFAFDKAGVYTIIAESSEEDDVKLVPAVITVNVTAE